MPKYDWKPMKVWYPKSPDDAPPPGMVDTEAQIMRVKREHYKKLQKAKGIDWPPKGSLEWYEENYPPKPQQDDSDQGQDVPRPVENQQYHDAGKAKQRASGGRVVASNINHNPSEAQKEAGNYAKDKVCLHGLTITIENAKGHKRRGVGRDGKPWEVVMPAHYGYVNGSVGADKDHVDCYVGPHTAAPDVYVIDQRDAETGAFDEHKCFIGVGSERQALQTYLRGFSDGKGKQRFGAMKRMPIEEFKEWVFSPKAKKPIAR